MSFPWHTIQIWVPNKQGYLGRPGLAKRNQVFIYIMRLWIVKALRQAFSKSFYRLISWAIAVNYKFSQVNALRTQLITGQHWLGQWLGAAITWTNVDPDLCRHMASLGHSELIPRHHYEIKKKSVRLQAPDAVSYCVCNDVYAIF